VLLKAAATRVDGVPRWDGAGALVSSSRVRSMRALALTLGHLTFDLAAYLGELGLFSLEVCRTMFSSRLLVGETVRQIYSIGAKSLPLTTVAAGSVGVVLGMQTVGVLSRFGIESYVAIIVGQAMVRELGPVVTALMVAGRAGAGISAEIGSMRVTRQIDALQVSAIDPIRYLVVCRVVACMLVLPLLTAVADAVGMLGGLVVGASLANIPPSYYVSMTVRFIGVDDIVPGLLKTIVFGLIIGIVACYQGFSTKGGTEGVGVSVTTAVVASSLGILLSDVLLTRILLLIFG